MRGNVLGGVVLTQVLVAVEAVSGSVCGRIVSGRRAREITLVALFEVRRRVSTRETLELTFEEFKMIEFGVDQMIFLRNSGLGHHLVVGQHVVIDLVKSVTDVVSLFSFIKSFIQFIGSFWAERG